MGNKLEKYIITNKQGEYYSGWLDSYIHSSWESEFIYVGGLITIINDIEIYNSIEIAKNSVNAIAKYENQDVSDYKILKLKIEISEVKDES